MNLHILDTDHVTLHQHGHEYLTARIQACASDELAITIITIEEQMRGRLAQIGRSGVDLAIAYELLRATAGYFCDLPILAFDAEAHRHFLQLRERGIRIGTLDLRIAAIALTQNAVLLIRNRRDFEMVPGLRLEDWSQ